MSDTNQQTPEGRRRVKDLLTLHLPLVIVVAFCAFATVIEFQRAQEGVSRAWVYTFQWPIIGLFAVVVWNRYRKHGNLTRWFTDRIRARIAAMEPEETADEARAEKPIDPDEAAWQDYVDDLRRREQHPRESPDARP